MSDARVVQAGESRSARVESLRAIAATGVLASHAWGYSQGWNDEAIYGTYFDRLLLLGGSMVVLFFCLTGYLLFLPFARRWFAGGDGIDIGRYSANRALRILPLYFVSIAVLLVLEESGGSLEQWLKFGLLSQTFFTDTVGTVNGPLWSVVVELHFYLLLPFFAFVLAKASRGSLRAAALIVLGLAVASAVLRYETRVGPEDPRLWQYSLPATFYWFTAGIFLAMLRVAWQDRRPGWLRGPLASPAAWLAVAVALWLWQADRFWDWPAALASFFTVGACVLPLRDAAPLRVLEWRPLALLGIASYSLYVWHEPIVRELSERGVDGFPALLALGLAVSVAVAALSYRVIETPFLRLRRRWSRSSAPQEADAGRVATDPVPA